jgi:hypothetical protein
MTHLKPVHYHKVALSTFSLAIFFVMICLSVVTTAADRSALAVTSQSSFSTEDAVNFVTTFDFMNESSEQIPVIITKLTIESYGIQNNQYPTVLFSVDEKTISKTKNEIGPVDILQSPAAILKSGRFVISTKSTTSYDTIIHIFGCIDQNNVYNCKDSVKMSTIVHKFRPDGTTTTELLQNSPLSSSLTCELKLLEAHGPFHGVTLVQWLTNTVTTWNEAKPRFNLPFLARFGRELMAKLLQIFTSSSSSESLPFVQLFADINQSTTDSMKCSFTPEIYNLGLLPITLQNLKFQVYMVSEDTKQQVLINPLLGESRVLPATQPSTPVSFTVMANTFVNTLTPEFWNVQVSLETKGFVSTLTSTQQYLGLVPTHFDNACVNVEGSGLGMVVPKYQKVPLSNWDTSTHDLNVAPLCLGPGQSCKLGHGGPFCEFYTSFSYDCSTTGASFNQLDDYGENCYITTLSRRTYSSSFLNTQITSNSFEYFRNTCDNLITRNAGSNPADVSTATHDNTRKCFHMTTAKVVLIAPNNSNLLQYQPSDISIKMNLPAQSIVYIATDAGVPYSPPADDSEINLSLNPVVNIMLNSLEVKLVVPDGTNTPPEYLLPAVNVMSDAVAYKQAVLQRLVPYSLPFGIIADDAYIVVKVLPTSFANPPADTARTPSFRISDPCGNACDQRNYQYCDISKLGLDSFTSSTPSPAKCTCSPPLIDIRTPQDIQDGKPLLCGAPCPCQNGGKCLYPETVNIDGVNFTPTAETPVPPYVASIYTDINVPAPGLSSFIPLVDPINNSALFTFMNSFTCDCPLLPAELQSPNSDVKTAKYAGRFCQIAHHLPMLCETQCSGYGALTPYKSRVSPAGKTIYECPTVETANCNCIPGYGPSTSVFKTDYGLNSTGFEKPYLDAYCDSCYLTSICHPDNTHPATFTPSRCLFHSKCICIGGYGGDDCSLAMLEGPINFTPKATTTRPSTSSVNFVVDADNQFKLPIVQKMITKIVKTAIQRIAKSAGVENPIIDVELFSVGKAGYNNDLSRPISTKLTFILYYVSKPIIIDPVDPQNPDAMMIASATIETTTKSKFSPKFLNIFHSQAPVAPVDPIDPIVPVDPDEEHDPTGYETVTSIWPGLTADYSSDPDNFIVDRTTTDVQRGCLSDPLRAKNVSSCGKEPNSGSTTGNMGGGGGGSGGGTGGTTLTKEQQAERDRQIASLLGLNDPSNQDEGEVIDPGDGTGGGTDGPDGGTDGTPKPKPKKSNSTSIIIAVVVIVGVLGLFIGLLFLLRYLKKEQKCCFAPKKETQKGHGDIEFTASGSTTVATVASNSAPSQTTTTSSVQLTSQHEPVNDPSLPQDWSAFKDTKENKMFYMNSKTMQSSWVHPNDTGASVGNGW